MAVLGTRFVDFDVERRVLGDVEIVSGPGRDRAEVLAVAAEADVVLAGASPRFDADTLDGLNCRGIVRLGVGVDSVDLEAARRRGMWVAYVPDYGTEAVALHTVTLILAAMRRLPMADRRIRSGEWGFAPFRPLHLPSSATAGVVGYGRIGRRVTDLLVAIGFGTVLVTDPMVREVDASAEVVPFAELLSRSDVVTLHAPPPDDGPLLGRGELGTMRLGSILVNTSRGSLVDTAALVDALLNGNLSVAALDVFSPEPPDVSVFGPVADQVILTPHMAWYTEETENELRRQGAAEARRIIDGERPLHAVVQPHSDEETT